MVGLRGISRADSSQDNDREPRIRWQTPRLGDQKAVSNNAVYRKPRTDGGHSTIHGQLLSQSIDVGLRDTSQRDSDRPIDDPFGDQIPAFRNQSEQRVAPDIGEQTSRDRNQLTLDSGYTGRPNSNPTQQDPPANVSSNSDTKTNASIVDKSCDQFRAELLGSSISAVDVNISAGRPKLQQRQSLSPQPRTWSDSNGRTLATGTLVDLHHGYVVIQRGKVLQRIAVSRLSDSDLAAIAYYWRLPSECTLGDYSPVSRCWLPQTVTWKASNLCHKPLYFEDEQLERYGHSAGPMMQPIKSTAHFFVRFLAWPYATAIHPPNECQYALGFYRPGNCALGC